MSSHWTRSEYFANRKKLESDWILVVLVDMIWQPVEGSVSAYEDLFFWGHYPPGTYFVLYCRTGCSLAKQSSMQLSQALPEYHFVDIVNGRAMYELEFSNYQ